MAIVYDDEKKPKSRIVYDDEPAPQEPKQPAEPPTGIWDRMKDRSDKVMAPTATAEAIGLKPGIAADIVGAPERTGRALAGAFGTWADIAGKGIEMAGTAANKLSGGRLGELGKKVIKTAAPGLEPIGKMGQMYGRYKESQPESKQANLSFGEDAAAGLGLFSAPGAAGAVAKVPSAILEGTGNALKSAGRKGMEETYKITTPIAKEAGKSKFSGTQKILDWMDWFKLEGRPKAVIQKAQTAIDKNDELAEKLMTDYIAKNPNEPIHTTKVFGDLWTDLNDAKIKGTALADIETQDKAMQQISQMLARKGLTGNIPVNKIPELKTVLKEEVGLFTKGSVTPETNLLKTVGDEYYRRIKASFEDKIPEIAEPNNNIHKLIIIKKAAEDASQRIGNRYDLGLREILGMTGIPTVAGIATSGDIGLTGAAALAGGVLASKKLLGGGRIAAGQMKLGRLAKKAGEAINPSNIPSRLSGLKSKIGNERGSVGGYNKQVSDVARTVLEPPETILSAFAHGKESIFKRISNVTQYKNKPIDATILKGESGKYRILLHSPNDYNVIDAGALLRKEGDGFIIENIANQKTIQNAIPTLKNIIESNFGKIKIDIGAPRSKLGKLSNQRESVGGDEGFIGTVGTRGDYFQNIQDKAMGRPIPDKWEAVFNDAKNPRTIEQMRTTLEKMAPVERSAMIERIKKMYGNNWKDYAPLFGTLGIGAAGTGGGLTAYEILNRKR
jgi:hypothetical protein